MVAGGSRGRGRSSGANGGWWVGSESEGIPKRMGADGSEAEKKGRLGWMEVVGPRGSFLTGGWCRPFNPARLGVPQIGSRGVGGPWSGRWNGGTTAGR